MSDQNVPGVTPIPTVVAGSSDGVQPAAVVPSPPLVQVDTSKINASTETVTKAIVPILSTKVHATIYAVGGIAGPVLIAVGDVLGGQIGAVCQAAGGAIGVATASFALSHASD